MREFRVFFHGVLPAAAMVALCLVMPRTEGGPEPLGLPPAAPGANRAAHLLAEGPVQGIALGLFSQDPRYDYVQLLEEIQDTGSPWVSLVCNFYQPRADSVNLPVADPRTAPWPRIALTIRHARALGLRVMLFPILLLQHPESDDWRGTIAPTDRTEWHRQYRGMLLKLAEIAEREGVELLSVGSEFNSMQGDTDAWQSLIADVRQVYSGAVTYSVNWDTLNEPRFFDDLDFVGMTTYFSLTDKNDPTVDELVAAWAPLREDILLWRANHGRPILFTEVGFPSLDGANKDPWNYFISQTVDLAEQADCFEAFRRVWQGDPSLDGLFFYNWFGPGGPEDGGYTPRGKPASEVIRTWFPAPTVPNRGVDKQ